MSERIEAAGRAIHRNDRAESTLLSETEAWNSMPESGRESYRNDAASAIDAYRTLTDDQWGAQRENVARAFFEHRASQQRNPMTVAEAEATMTALGLRRATPDRPL